MDGDHRATLLIRPSEEKKSDFGDSSSPSVPDGGGLRLTTSSRISPASIMRGTVRQQSRSLVLMWFTWRTKKTSSGGYLLLLGGHWRSKGQRGVWMGGGGWVVTWRRRSKGLRPAWSAGPSGRIMLTKTPFSRRPSDTLKPKSRLSRSFLILTWKHSYTASVTHVTTRHLQKYTIKCDLPKLVMGKSSFHEVDDWIDETLKYKVLHQTNMSWLQQVFHIYLIPVSGQLWCTKLPTIPLQNKFNHNSFQENPMMTLAQDVSTPNIFYISTIKDRLTTSFGLPGLRWWLIPNTGRGHRLRMVHRKTWWPLCVIVSADTRWLLTFHLNIQQI